MDAVGDVADGHRILGAAREEAHPHLARDLSVQRGYGINAAREPEPQHGHTEHLLLDCRVFAAQRHQPFMRQSERLAQRPQVLLHQGSSRSGRGRPVLGCAL